MYKFVRIWYNKRMFTGIIEETGQIKSITNKSMEISCHLVLEDVKLGDSIAVNGVCLTVSKFTSVSFVADVSPETFKVTNFYKLKVGDSVNLERAMPMNGRFGGHIVSGHVDDVAKIVAINKNSEFYDLKIELNDEQIKYVIKKGSITVNGISLTVAEISEKLISIAVIPHTYENTNLLSLKAGDYVNIELDMIAKYVEKFLSTDNNRTGVSMEFLQRNGFC